MRTTLEDIQQVVERVKRTPNEAFWKSTNELVTFANNFEDYFRPFIFFDTDENELVLDWYHNGKTLSVNIDNWGGIFYQLSNNFDLSDSGWLENHAQFEEFWNNWLKA